MQDSQPIPVSPGKFPASATQASTFRNIFFGEAGLRPGWSLALYILLIAVFFSAAAGILHKLSAARALSPPASTAAGHGAHQPIAFLPALFNEGVPFLFVCLATWIMSRIERRPLSAYGTGGEHRLRHLAGGLFWGVTCLSLLVAALWRTHLLVFDGRLLFGAAILRNAAQWSLAFFAVALFEEYFMRGYLQLTLARALASLFNLLFHSPHAATSGFWTAALLISVLFGLGHGSNPGESPIGLLSAGLAGMVFCLSLWRTGSLWWAIGFHTTWDWAQSYLYGVADSGTMARGHLLATHPLGSPLLSGGTTGPEGSLYILPMMTLIAAIILLTLRPTRTVAETIAPTATPDLARSSV